MRAAERARGWPGAGGQKNSDSVFGSDSTRQCSGFPTFLTTPPSASTFVSLENGNKIVLALLMYNARFHSILFCSILLSTPFLSTPPLSSHSLPSPSLPSPLSLENSGLDSLNSFQKLLMFPTLRLKTVYLQRKLRNRNQLCCSFLFLLK